MNGLERQQFVREQRERAKREAKKAREELARRRAALPPSEDLPEQREGREQRPEFARQRQHDRLVYKSHDNSAPATMPAADTDERIADERQFIFDVLAEALGELTARYDREIAALRDKVDCYIKTPLSMVEAARELHAQTDRALAAAAALDAASERDQQRRSDPLDLPALPLRRPN